MARYDWPGERNPDKRDRARFRAEALFERFATRSRGGTGLGLFIVRELCRAQGGDAWYRPEDRAFVASFPRHEEVS